jgi:uncharacterized protein
MQTPHQRLQSALRKHESLLVAYSGGIDSAYLAYEAHLLLGSRVLAVIADSASLPREHLHEATVFANAHNIPLRVIHTDELANPDYIRNDKSRCFHCKDTLFRAMNVVAAETGIHTIAYGRNLDDDGDFRPGQQAAANHQAVAPLAEAGLGKAEIRALALAANLTIWDKPASACLASRIEPGRPVTAEALAQVEAAELALNRLGFRQLRVRHHGTVARVEIERSELARALSLDMLGSITAAVLSAGFSFSTLDTEGYRSGSMNTLLTSIQPAQKAQSHAA